MTDERRIGFAPLIGLVVTLPYMILEWSTASDAPRSHFSIPSFAVMWLVAGLVVFVSAKIVQTIRAGNMTTARRERPESGTATATPTGPSAGFTAARFRLLRIKRR